MRRRLALDRGIEREQHFLDVRVARAFDQPRDGEIVGADPVERRQRAAEHVIEPIEHARAFERPKIADLLDDTDERAITRRAAAERARAVGVDVAASLAGEDGVAGLGKRGSERLEQLLLLLDEMKCGAARRAGPEPREPREQLDQPLDLWSCRDLRHGYSAKEEPSVVT